MIRSKIFKYICFAISFSNASLCTVIFIHKYFNFVHFRMTPNTKFWSNIKMTAKKSFSEKTYNVQYVWLMNVNGKCLYKPYQYHSKMFLILSIN